MFISATVVIDLLDLVILNARSRGILLLIGVRCVSINSSDDKSENFVIP